MKSILRAGFIVLILAMFNLLVACAPKGVVVDDYIPLTNLSGLEVKHNQRPTVLYTRPNAPGLGAYSRFIIDPIQVLYSDAHMQEISKQQLVEMQLYFKRAMEKELHLAGYKTVTIPQAKTLRVSFIISGLKGSMTGSVANVAAMGAGAVVGVPMIWAINVGEVTVEGVFRESLSHRIDAVAITRTQGSHTFNKQPWSTWADVEDAFDEWAIGFREGVDRAHGRY